MLRMGTSRFMPITEGLQSQLESQTALWMIMSLKNMKTLFCSSLGYARYCVPSLSRECLREGEFSLSGRWVALGDSPKEMDSVECIPIEFAQQ